MTELKTPTGVGADIRLGGGTVSNQDTKTDTNPQSRSFRTGTKRDKLTEARAAVLDQQIIDVLQEDHPQSVRHVFYRMTDPRLAEPVEKSDSGYRKVQNRIKLLRRSGRLPYGWIADSTRMGWHTDTYASPAEFIRTHAGAYRADLWQQSDYHVEVWVESRSIAGVVRAVCEEFAVSLYPCGGFASITLCYEAAQYIQYIHEETGRHAQILFIGDYDPAGVLINESLERELREHLGDVPMEFDRIAVTEQQISDWDLPTKPRKKSDKRSLHIKETVEAEAIPAGMLRNLLRDRIESYLPPHALEVVRTAEESERAFLQSLATNLEVQP